MQKRHERIARIAECMHMEKRDAWKSLRAVLQTWRDGLPVDMAVHFGTQLPHAGARPVLREMGAIEGADQNVARRTARGSTVANYR